MSLRLSIAAALVAAATLAGCGPPRHTSPSRIVLWVQMEPAERARLERRLAEFRAANPGLTTEVVAFGATALRDRFGAEASAGRGPQIVYGPSDLLAPLALVRLIRPLDGAMAPGFFDRFVPQSLDTLEGHLWAAPDQVTGQLALVCNRALVPRAPATTAELLALARDLARPAVGGAPARPGCAIALAEPWWLVPFLAGHGGWPIDDARRPTLDTPAMVRALALVRTLRDSPGVAVMAPAAAESLFASGCCAMIVDGPWSFAACRRSGVDLAVAPLPRLPEGVAPRPMLTSRGYSISIRTRPAQLAHVVELIDLLTSPAAQRADAGTLGALPSARAAWADSALRADPLLAGSWKALEGGRRAPTAPEMRVLWDAMRAGLAGVLDGSRTPAEAARRMQATAEQQLAGFSR